MHQPLGFSGVDDLSFAAQRGRLEGRAEIPVFTARELGPFIEYSLLGAARKVPKPKEAKWLNLGELEELYEVLRRGHASWVSPGKRHMGVYRLTERKEPDDARWIRFCLAAQKAAEANGFQSETAAQLAAALGELYSNIYEHSDAAQTGVVTFKASLNVFEFVVADWGRGVLKSLTSCPEYAELIDDGEALQLALTEGVSRFGKNSGRGHGFRPLFRGLANLNGSLRFRGGNRALVIEGNNPSNVPWTLEEKVPINGFFSSVLCRSI